MKLSHPYALRITGDPAAFLKCARSPEQFTYLVTRLFSGEEVAEGEFQSWGLNVSLVDEFIAIERGDG